MPARTDEWTAEMARAIPDETKRYEVLDGALFGTPAPSLIHQRALRVLYDLLAAYVHKHGIGEIFWSPADVEFSPRRLVQPDLFVAPLVGGRQVRTWRDVTALILAIEALSPSTAYADRHVKRPIYMEEKVGEYWIVDIDARLFERWKKGEARPEICDMTLEWQPVSSIPALTIDVTTYFAEVLGA